MALSFQELVALGRQALEAFLTQNTRCHRHPRDGARPARHLRCRRIAHYLNQTGHWRLSIKRQQLQIKEQS
jgi:hypothetical protein